MAQTPIAASRSGSADPERAPAASVPAKYAQFDSMEVDVPSNDRVSELELNYAFLGRACAVLGTSGLIFGYDIGVISGALPTMSARFGLSPIEKGLIVSGVALGATIGGVIAGYVCDWIGRKRTVHIQNVLFTSGTLTIVCAQSAQTIVFGRIVLGLGAAFSAVASLSYLCEVSPLEIRGWVTSTYELLVVTGILLAFVVDYSLAQTEGGWRWMFGAILVAVIGQTLGIYSMPDSPRWLLAKGDERGCRHALCSAYKGDAAVDLALSRLQDELLAAQAADGEQFKIGQVAVTSPRRTTKRLANLSLSENSQTSSRIEEGRTSPRGASTSLPTLPQLPLSATAVNTGDADNFQSKIDRVLAPLLLWKLPLMLGSLIGLCMHFSGGVMVRNYAGEIFLLAGLSQQRASQFLVYLGLVKWVMTSVSIVLVDITGRRPLLFGGTSCMALGFLCLDLFFSLVFNLWG